MNVPSWSIGLGGLRGLIGVFVIALGVGLGYGSLVATVLAQWFDVANTPMGILLLGASAALLVLVWLMGAILR